MSGGVYAPPSFLTFNIQNEMITNNIQANQPILTALREFDRTGGIAAPPPGIAVIPRPAAFPAALGPNLAQVDYGNGAAVHGSVLISRTNFYICGYIDSAGTVIHIPVPTYPAGVMGTVSAGNVNGALASTTLGGGGTAMNGNISMMSLLISESCRFEALAPFMEQLLAGKVTTANILNGLHELVTHFGQTRNSVGLSTAPAAYNFRPLTLSECQGYLATALNSTDRQQFAQFANYCVGR